MTLKLSELQATRAAMTDRGEWRQGNFERYNLFVHDAEGERVLLRANTHFPYVENINGIVATHNAADVLIECVRTDLEFRAANKAAAKARFAWSRADDAGDPGAAALLKAVDDAERHYFACQAAYDAALGKVTL
jgi:hypothetical protein